MNKKPVKLKILEGNPGHEAKANINYDEPVPEIGDPTAPKYLTPRALTIWQDTCYHLKCMSILAKCDEIIIEAFARTVDRWQTLEREINAEGQFMVTPMRERDGKTLLRDVDDNIITILAENPRLKESRLLLGQVRVFAVELGLSPSSRAKLSVTSNKPQKKSKMEELLSRGRNAG